MPPRSRTIRHYDQSNLPTSKAKTTQSSKLKRIVDDLRASREPISASSLSTSLQNQLHNNPSVQFLPQQNAFVYKPKYSSVTDKEGLLKTLVAAWPSPCFQPDLEDAYPNAYNDLQQLRKEFADVIWTVRHPTKRVEQWYCSPNALRQHSHPVLKDGYQQLDESDKENLSLLWDEMAAKMPRVEDIPVALDKLGIKPMASVRFELEEYKKRKRIEEFNEAKKSNKRRRRNTKVTNVHMMNQDQ